ncbi:Rv3654c family TadE-like protein [Streptomyces sp. N35]|uniref:Rv3654c family TadE-like protein n=1 Tax=Streptomyces sp. N35 TaxID=2795730 RepID=UPI0027DBF64B|nr:Rv3654c family TadE-like protein [Streptomyces sp. N35]
MEARARDDRGSATVWVVGLIGALCLILAGLLLVAQAMVARHRAGAAADLAALAAADHALRGQADACAGAGRVARAQGTDVVRCAVRGEIADVTVRARSGPMSSAVRSRAGPPGPEVGANVGSSGPVP